MWSCNHLKALRRPPEPLLSFAAYTIADCDRVGGGDLLVALGQRSVFFSYGTVGPEAAICE